ncbi:glutathione S-transferase [Pseudomonas benzenivorans]|nr:glutathione S-transferase family protein [Pseudomonas benzenivorans]SDH03028.1 glutathione S-transferase [Pseudomonas benzenivorans]
MHYAKLVLVSHTLCPYVQRSVITLNEKQIAHERIYVDLGNKPDWFLAMSPLGKVPLLQVDDGPVLFESAVICEFLDEITPDSLHPVDPLVKARHRAWIEFGSQLLNDIAKLYNAPLDAAFLDSLKVIRDKMRRLENEVRGPFFAGARFSIVDATYGPVFRYFDTLDRYLPLDVFEHCPHLQRWRAQLAERPSVKAAVSPDYPQLLKDFLLHRGSILSRRMALTDMTAATA